MGETEEVEHLVSWDAGENLGKIKGSEWICPSEECLEDVGYLVAMREQITDQDLLESGGRKHHLELLKFPEGYHAALVIDSKTGDEQTGIFSACRVGGVCRCGVAHEPGVTVPVLAGHPLPLEGGRELSEVFNLGTETRSTITSTAIRYAELGYPYGRLAVCIIPQSRWLEAVMEGNTEVLPDTYVRIQLTEGDDGIKAGLHVLSKSEFGTIWDRDVQAIFKLDARGRVTSLCDYKDGLFELLGVRVEREAMSGYQFNGWADVTDQRQQQKALTAAAEALGSEQGERLDLYLTASGLYAAMEKRSFDPAASLVFA
jgi:hypothetical protein